MLHLSNLYPPLANGGYEQVLAGTVDWLAQLGVDNRVLTTSLAPSGQVDQPDPDVDRRLLPYLPFADEPSASPAEAHRIEAYNQQLLLEQVRSFGPDVIALWSMAHLSASLVGLAARLAPTVAFVHEYWPINLVRQDPWFKLDPADPEVRRAIADGVEHRPAWQAEWAGIRWVYVSRFVRAEVLRRAGPTLDGAVLHSGTSQPLRSGRGDAGWHHRLLYAGRLDLRKGLLTAFGALAYLDERYQLVVAGGELRPQDRELVEQAARPWCDSGRLTLVGHRRPDELPALYGAADVVLVPSEWAEPWGLAALDGMANDRPVVATGVGGTVEYLRDGENCLLFPAGSAAGLAEAVQRLAAEPDLRGRLREAGRRTAAGHSAQEFYRGAARLLAEAR